MFVRLKWHKENILTVFSGFIRFVTTQHHIFLQDGDYLNWLPGLLRSKQFSFWRL
jgi:hypothetical protein